MKIFIFNFEAWKTFELMLYLWQKNFESFSSEMKKELVSQFRDNSVGRVGLLSRVESGGHSNLTLLTLVSRNNKDDVVFFKAEKIVELNRTGKILFFSISALHITFKLSNKLNFKHNKDVFIVL